MQDAAYATLLRVRRQQLHAAIAAALERKFPEIVTAQPELLAYHCTEAGLTQQAIENWRRAGERAIEGSANLEAIAHLTRGLEKLEDLPASPQRDEKELAFQVALLTPLFAARFGSTEGERAAARALELSRRVDADMRSLFRALFGLTMSYLVRGKIRIAREPAEQLLVVGERLHDPEPLGYAHQAMGNTLFWFWGAWRCTSTFGERDRPFNRNRPAPQLSVMGLTALPTATFSWGASSGIWATPTTR